MRFDKLSDKEKEELGEIIAASFVQAFLSVTGSPTLEGLTAEIHIGKYRVKVEKVD